MAIKKTCLRVRKAVGQENKSFAFKVLYQSSVVPGIVCLPSSNMFLYHAKMHGLIIIIIIIIII